MKKTKTIIVVVLSLLAIGVILCMVFGNKFSNNHGNSKEIEFKEIKLTTTTTASGKWVYELKQQVNGMLAEYYYETEEYKNGKYVSIKTSIHKTVLGLDKYQELNELLIDCGIRKWNGWHKTNPFVLDGGGFSFVLSTKSGEIIEASGTNMTPKNYAEIYSAIENLCTKEVIKDRKFETDFYEIKLPETWVGNVIVNYNDSFTNFSIKFDDEEHTLLNIYFNDYGYYEGEEYHQIKKKRVKGEELFFFYAKGDLIDDYIGKMSDEQLAVVNNLDEDIKIMMKSFK